MVKIACVFWFNLYAFFESRGEEGGRNGARFSDLGELEQSTGHAFHHDDAVNLSRSKLFTTLSLFS